MSLKRKLAVFTAAATLAPLGIFVLPAGTAVAHGYISSPPSRQAQCAQGVVSCGSIKYEPQSVEGPKGLRSCNGGVGRFAELNDDSLPWRATSVGSTVSFTWTFTVRHRTANFEYYIGNTRVATFSGNMQQPPPGLTHTINLGNYSGRQKLLAVWNIGDTSNAFYACVDLQIGRQASSADATEKSPEKAPRDHDGTWAAETAYTTGSTVTFDGTTYRALRDHTALPGWEPASTPSLWRSVQADPAGR